MSAWTTVLLLKLLVVAGGVMTAAAYLVLLERRIAAWVQDRFGPNRVGIPLTKIRIWGLGQPLADGLKFIFKEEYTPGHVSRWLYWIAPVTVFTAALATFAVVPFGSVIPLTTDAKPIELVIAPHVDAGLLYVFAMGSIAVYGVILGGWASNNKYSFLGGLRSSAQLIAYELPLSLGMLGVAAAAGTLDVGEIIRRQAETGQWYGLAQPLGLVVFFVAAFAEAGRLPFDLPECEQELVGGYHTEYSGMKLMLFLVSEFLHMIAAAFLLVILFLGGWHFWGLTGSTDEVGWWQAIVRVIVLLAKVFAVIVFIQVARWSWPRFRFDQLMALAWKVLLPLGMINFVAVAASGEWARQRGLPGERFDWGAVLVGWIVVAAALLAVGWSRPRVADNRPLRQFQPWDIDWQI